MQRLEEGNGGGEGVAGGKAGWEREQAVAELLAAVGRRRPAAAIQVDPRAIDPVIAGQQARQFGDLIDHP